MGADVGAGIEPSLSRVPEPDRTREAKDDPAERAEEKGGATVRVYEDSRGWRFKVMGGLGENTYKARYQKPGKSGWHCVAVLPWRINEETAQADLDEYARSHRMKEIEP